MAARATLQDVRAKEVAWQARALGQRQCLVEERDRSRDARELVPADRESIEHVSELEVRVRGLLDDLARALEELDRLLDLPDFLERPRLTREDAELERACSGARHLRSGIAVR